MALGDWMEAMSSEPLSAATPADVRVLVVEDDPLFRRFVTAALGRSQVFRAQTRTAGTLSEGVGLLAREAFDCVLLDLELPDSQGVATVERLLEAARDVPIVILTGIEEGSLDHMALLAGAQEYVEKSRLEVRTLEVAMRHAIDRGRWAATLASTNRALAARNRDLDDFAHVVSHDLKAPLRSVHRRMAEALQVGDPASLRACLADASERIERLSGMIDGVLRLAKAGRAASSGPLPTQEVLERVLASVAVPAGFAVLVPQALPPLLGDAQALEQVFQNLVDNALKHHDRSTGVVEVAWREVGPMAEFLVSDDGPGFPDGIQGNLFVPFQAAGANAGSGIGLALVRKVVEAQGGRIACLPRSPRGSVVRFTWPLAPAGPLAPAS